jgi:hypothetical protein
MIIGPQPQY